MHVLRVAVAISLVATAASVTAFAQSQDPQVLVREGLALRRDGHDVQALERFRRAYEIGHGANALGLMGLAEGALGQWVAAERDVREALAHLDDPWVQRRRSDLEVARGVIQQHLGTLEVTGEPVGAEVSVNGDRVGVLPLATVTLAVGTGALEVRSDGYYPLSRPINVEAGTTARERVSLQRIPTDAVNPTAGNGTASARHERNAAERLFSSPLALTISGVGVVATIVGAIMLADSAQTALQCNQQPCIGNMLAETQGALPVYYGGWGILAGGLALVATGVLIGVFSGGTNTARISQTAISFAIDGSGSGVRALAILQF